MNQNDITRALGRIEGQLEGMTKRFDAVDTKLTEIHELGSRVTQLETRSNRLVGALTLLGFIWTAVTAFLLKVWAPHVR